MQHNFVFYGNSGNDILRGVVWASGGTGDDSIEGALTAGNFHGNGEYLHLGGEAGNDTLIGGNLNDVLIGGTGNDSLQGGTGADWLAGDLTDYGGTGGHADSGQINSRNWRPADSIAQLSGGTDTLYGGAGNDVLIGGGGADFIYGEADADNLSGEDGNDLLVGGEGNDTSPEGDRTTPSKAAPATIP